MSKIYRMSFAFLMVLLFSSPILLAQERTINGTLMRFVVDAF